MDHGVRLVQEKRTCQGRVDKHRDQVSARGSPKFYSWPARFYVNVHGNTPDEVKAGHSRAPDHKAVPDLYDQLG